jgi:hypothetical protein
LLHQLAHVPFSLSQIMISDLLLGMVVSVCTCWFHNMVTLPSWHVSTDFIVVVVVVVVVVVYIMSTTDQKIALPFWKLSAFMFQIETSEILLCWMLPFKVKTVLLLDVLQRLMPPVGIVRSVLINDLLDVDTPTK